VIGKNIKQPQGYKAFVPEPFPPPGLLDLSSQIILKTAQASRLLGKLDGITQLLPDVDFFILMYVRKEAVASSQIEGTKATLIDALEAEVKIDRGRPTDVDDILHYIHALNFGMKRLRELPLSLRFMREIHRELMETGRTSHFSDPGNFRKSQNWFNGKGPADAEFVPPPEAEMKRALGDLEKFIHSRDDTPPLVKAALMHAQFETIHPFLDGNGRTGRMLITFYLWQEMLLERPVLYLSSYFKKYQKLYYQRLAGYHQGNSEKWLVFFLDGVIETAEAAIETARQITLLREHAMIRIGKMNRTSYESASKILPRLFAQPIVTVSTMQAWVGFNTRSGAQKLIDRLVEAGILEIKDESKKYGRSYIYKEYLEIFDKE